MGIAIVIPSGILCRAIAVVNFIPKLIFLVVDIYVIIPSGILCNMIANIDINPILYRELCFLL